VERSYTDHSSSFLYFLFYLDETLPKNVDQNYVDLK
jgi:hypothetical protein